MNPAVKRVLFSSVTVVLMLMGVELVSFIGYKLLIRKAAAVSGGADRGQGRDGINEAVARPGVPPTAFQVFGGVYENVPHITRISASSDKKGGEAGDKCQPRDKGCSENLPV